MAATLLASERLRSSPRRTRSPQHPFYLRYRPWQIQPFVIAPVLPGETLTGATLQSRVVSDPIKNPLMGWWTEYYFFYVKHRDMTDRDKLTAMMLNVQEDVSTLKVAAKAAHYHQASSFDWVEMCKRRVVEEYFRDGDDAYPGVEIDSMPVAAINQNSWLDSAYLDDDIPDATVETTATDLSLEGFEQAYITWQFMRANQLIDMDYEDYLATYGIRKNRTELHKPELIRYVRDWTYPTNTIDPSNGAARSAVSWSFTERISKDRFFTEPGFVFSWVSQTIALALGWRVGVEGCSTFPCGATTNSARFCIRVKAACVTEAPRLFFKLSSFAPNEVFGDEPCKVSYDLHRVELVPIVLFPERSSLVRTCG